MPGAFDDLIPQQQAQSAPPAFIPGTPKSVSPIEVQRMNNEQERLRMSREDQQRQNENAQRDREKAQRDAIEFDNKQKQRSLTGGVEASVEQGKAASFYKRALGASQDYSKSGMEPDSMIGKFGSQTFPQITSGLSSDQRNAQRSREREFIGAVLRYDSGAAIPDSEYANAYETYFPSSSAGPEEIKQKAIARQRAIDGLRIGAGPAASLVDAPQTETVPTPPGYDQAHQAYMSAYKGRKIEPQDYEAFRLSLDQQFGLPPVPPGTYANDKYVTGWNAGKQGQTAVPDAVRPVQEQQGTDQQAPGLWDSFKSGVGDVVETVGDVAGLVGNPANAAVNYALGTNLSTDLGQTFRDASGLPDISNPYAKAVTQGGVGAMLGTGGAQAARGLVTGPVGSGVVNALTSNPGRQVVAGAGAGVSSETARQAGFGPVGQLIAGVGGGAAAFGGANALLNAARRPTPNALASAASSQKVDLMPADTGGAFAKRMSGAAVQMPVASGQMVRGAERAQSQLKNALARVSSSQGDVATTDVAGQSIRTAGQNMAKRTGQTGSALYQRAERASQGVKSIKPINATAVIDENIARLGELKQTNAPLIQSLQKLKADISGGVTVSGLRDARTALSQGTFDGKLRSGQEKAIYKQVIAALSSDVEAGLVSAGKGDAARMFKTADAYWKKRVEHIDQVLEPIIGGNKGGEEIVQAVETMARGGKGGNMRLSSLLSELDPKEAGDVRALMIDRLGKATPGNQGAEGGDFSASTFLTNWNKFTPQAKASLFPDKGLRANLDEIALLSGATKSTQRFANTSGTAGAVNGAALGATAIANPPLATAILSGQYATGRLLSSPAFARWLARSPRTDNPAVNGKYLEQLSVVASREPIIANDARALQEALAGAFSPQRLAAQEKDRQQQ